MTVYERWYHEDLGVRAVRIQQGRVTGVCALSLDEAAEVALETLDYDGRPEAIHCVWERPERFCLFDPWRRGERVSPGTLPPARPAAARTGTATGLIAQALHRMRAGRRARR